MAIRTTNPVKQIQKAVKPLLGRGRIVVTGGGTSPQSPPSDDPESSTFDIVLSASEPDPADYEAGDLWVELDGGGSPLGLYVHTGADWEAIPGGAATVVGYKFWANDSSNSGLGAGEYCNGARTDFTLSHTPAANTLQVHLNGQWLVEGAGQDFTVSGDVVTFAVAPESTDQIGGNYLV